MSPPARGAFAQARDELEQPAGDDLIGEREAREGDEVVGQRQLCDMRAAEDERVAGGERGEREGRGLEGVVPPRASAGARQEHPGPRDERAAPGTDHDHGRDVDARSDA